MKKERNETSKNKWSRIFRKKWFFPAVYLTVAALLLTVVVLYQSVDRQIPKTTQNDESTENYQPKPHDEDDVTAVLDQEEVIKMPVTDQEQAEIVTKFYDYNANEEDREKALIFQNNRFYQSTGIDIASSEGESFDVLAALSGTVAEVKEDPILGNVIVLSHNNEVMTYYASLADVQVKEGTKVKQGEVLGKSGKNQFGKDNGIHVHFEIRKDGQHMNPETFFNQPVSKLEEVGKEVSESTEEPTEESTEEPTDEQVDTPEDAAITE